MKKAVALLRGINVGRAKRVAMADLRAVVEGLGYVDARTLLNSGNVVFGVPAKARGDAAARIEEAVAAQLGVRARVQVVPAAVVAAVVAANPLGAVATDPSKHLVTFVASPDALAALADLAARDWSPDAIRVDEHAVYTWSVEGILKSPVVTALAKRLGDQGTSRNWATVEKLHAMLA